jgi:hypothetical protein
MRIMILLYLREISQVDVTHISVIYGGCSEGKEIGLCHALNALVIKESVFPLRTQETTKKKR